MGGTYPFPLKIALNELKLEAVEGDFLYIMRILKRKFVIHENGCSLALFFLSHYNETASEFFFTYKEGIYG